MLSNKGNGGVQMDAMVLGFALIMIVGSVGAVLYGLYRWVRSVQKQLSAK
jgi:hypothetical protein